MRRTILLFLLLLSACAYSVTANTPDAPPTTFELACQGVELEYPGACDNLAPPTVVRSWIVADHVYNLMGNLRGAYYRGSQFVFVRPDLSPEAEQEVTIHETVHYIVDWAGIQLEKCDNEELAFKVGKAAVGVEYTDDWKTWYGCQAEENE